MKKPLLIILAAISLSTFASINITSTDMKWVIGNTWTMDVNSGVSIDNFTKTGTNVSWDLTSYSNSSTIDTVKILNKTAGTNSTIKIKSDIISGTNYEPLTNDWAMETFDVAGNDVAFLSGSHNLGFPHSENDTWSSTSSVVNLADYFNPYPTSITGSVIATGEVVTNYGTFSALLVEENFSIPGYTINETYYYWETKEYGRISILTSWRMDKLKILDIPPSDFYPVPKVWSSLVIFKPKKNFEYLKKSQNLEHITNIFFSQRRKMINKPFKQLFNDYERKAKKLNIDLNLRPQNLSVKNYIEICKLYENLA